MCAMLIGVPAGNPVRFTTNVAVAAVMLFAESRVMSNVMVALPLPLASAPVIGGFSLDVRRSAVNVGLVGVGEVGVLLLPQPAAMSASAIEARVKRFILR